MQRQSCHLAWAPEDFAFGLADSNLHLRDKQAAFHDRIFVNIEWKKYC